MSQAFDDGHAQEIPGAQAPAVARQHATGLAARLGLFNATMLVMGGIVGTGIFINPYVVARSVHTSALILGAWVVGGIIALTGAFIYAELAARMPKVGGQYAYLRQAYHPLLGFLYGWSLLLVSQTSAMAGVAVIFARYFVELTRIPVADSIVAALAMGLLTLTNCLGVRAGSTVQNALMVLKILAIALLVGAGVWFLAHAPNAPRAAWRPVLDRPLSLDFVTAMRATMVPVLFAYGGWQTSNFIAGEIREPRKNLPRALLLGVAGVVVLYVAVNFVCVRVLGSAGLAQTTTPASAVMRLALGKKGAAALAVAIAISALGFLSQGILTAPRVYFAMADDRLFFRSVAWVHPRTRVPVVAILLQGGLATAIALWGKYEQILSNVVSLDWIFFGLTASCLLVPRFRDQGDPKPEPQPNGHRVPGHPFTTVAFVAVAWLVAVNTFYKFPGNTLIGLAIVLAGIPVYFFWRRRQTDRIPIA